MAGRQQHANAARSDVRARGAIDRMHRRARRWDRRLRDAKVRQRRAVLATRGAGRIADAVGVSLLHCVGDSHARVFEHLRRSRTLRRTWLSVLAVPSATSYGLMSADSASGASHPIRRELDRLPAGRSVIFMFGEVDVASLCWRKASRDGSQPEDVLKRAADRYESFIRGYAGRLLPVVVAVPHPTVHDLSSGVLAARRDLTTPIEARMAMTVFYNDALAAMARRNRWRYVDTGRKALDTESGLVRSELVVDGDHHYEWSRHAELIAEELRALGYR